MKLIVYTSLFVFLFAGCSQQRTVYSELAEIDQLLIAEQTDSALKKLPMIDVRNLNEELSAYYYLLETQCQYKLYMPIRSDSVINIAETYYRKTGDEEKLARSLFYRSCVLSDIGKKAEALQCLKQAEVLIQKLSEDYLSHNVYYQLASLNSYYQEYQLALENIKKAIFYASKANRVLYLAYDYEKAAVYYDHFGLSDSSSSYIRKCISLINLIPEKPASNRARLFGNVGALYCSIDKDSAKFFLEKSFELDPQGNVCTALAELFLEEKDTSKAISILEEGIKVSDYLGFKEKNLLKLSDIMRMKGNFRQADELTLAANVLKDSLANRFHVENVKAQQIEFDRRVEQKQAEKAKWWLDVSVCFLAVVIFMMAWVYFRKKKKTSLALKEKGKLIEELREDRNDANKKLKATQDKMNSMKLDLQEHERKIRSYDRERKKRELSLEHGCILLESLLNQGNIALWNHQDYEDFTSYYRITNSKFAKEIDEEYTDLSPNQNVLVILEHIGMSDGDIMRAMNLANGALRTLRSRLKQRRLDGKTNS
ncbi:MAG: hypothetical protein IJK46_01440 [Prevotella sp.]|nr:hypothetical protein [Prevotella sp.]